MGKTTMIKRFVSLMVVFVMLISIIPSALANPADAFSDFPTGWSRPAMEAAVDNGLLVGIGGGKIGPQKYLTRAEMAAVMVRAFGATTYSDVSVFKDLDTNSWYYGSVASAVRMGALTGVSATEMAPNDYITREQVFSVLSRVLALSSNNTGALSKFKDKGQVSDWALNTVIPLVERGYITGDGKGNLNPKSYITREEFAQLMYTTIKRYITEPGTYTEDMEGIVVLRCGNVTLKDMYIEGDLVVGDGAARNSVTLDGVTVNGRLLTRGGTITVKATDINYGVFVLNPNGSTIFKNYKIEEPFKGIVEYTQAIFMTNAGSNAGISGGASQKYDVIFKLFEGDTVPYASIKVYDGKKIGRKMPADPEPEDIDGYTFNGWLDEDGDEVTEDTRVYDDMVVIADLDPIGEAITVTFFEGYGQFAEEIDEVELLLNDDGEANVDASDIPDLSGYQWTAYTKSDYMPSDYADYNGTVKVHPTFWYYDGTEWLNFDETVVLTDDTTVHVLYKQVEVSAFDTAVSTKYSSETRAVDSVISLSHGVTEQLTDAKNTGLPIYSKIDSLAFGILESKNLIDDERYINKINIPLPINAALTESLIQDVIKDRIENILDSSALYDKLFYWPEVEEYILSNYLSSLPTGLTQAQVRDLIKGYVEGLSALEKKDLRNELCDVIYNTDEYDDVTDAVLNNKPLTIDESNFKLVKEILKELETITFDTVMGLSHDSFFDKIVDIAGYNTCRDIFNEGRERYCEDLAALLDNVENGISTEETIDTAFELLFDPIGDILAPIYAKAQDKAKQKLMTAGVRYDENPYLQYLVEYDVIDRLFINTGVDTEYRTEYKLKDLTDYAAYAVELEIATNDAFMWYGELSDAEFDAVKDAVFNKIYAASDKLDGILEDFYYNDELPSKVELALTSVSAINNIYLKFEPKLKQVVGKYLNSNIHDEIENGTLDSNTKVQNAIDILVGNEDPVFTMDSLYEIFYNYDDKLQAKLQALVDSGKLDTAIAKFRNSSIGQQLGDAAIDDIVEIIETVAEYGIEEYLVNSTDITVIEQYKFTIGDRDIVITRSFIF